jgi:predicted SAM-dependent methyltransferase
MDLIKFKNKTYPVFQSEGNSAQFIMPFAIKICKGYGYDVGCGKIEWSLPNSVPIDLSFNDGFSATNLPKNEVDYIFSSHCLEHLDDWVNVMDYWNTMIRKGGVLFLYLPDYSQEYWRPWNNYKHKHVLDVNVIKDYMTDKGYINIFSSGIDLNNSFAIFGEKC